MFEHLKKTELERKHREAVNKEQNKNEWYRRNRITRNQILPEPDGSCITGDHDEDYVIDALFDIPNR